MSGEKNLNKLLGSMSPQLSNVEYVFCTVKNADYGDYAEAEPIASILEQEGLTLVLTRKSAEKNGLTWEGIFKCITLNIHSSLQATGLTAAVSGKLSEHRISANVIAGFFHDHIFVPADLSEKALALLSELSLSAKRSSEHSGKGIKP